ncbi:helix-turn-helix domain-containing protein, partial [Oleiphilus sp. HI0067]
GLFDRVGSAAGQAFRIAKRTTDTSYKVGKALIQSQDQLKLMVAAGESLKDLREVAGLTINELNEALQLKDKSLIEAVENGTATLSFELILRLSSLLARNDPIPFILKYSRTYSPETWRLLHDWGAGRLPLQYQREREFINILRSKDSARELSDEGFAHVLAYTREAFNMALHFVEEQEKKS